MDHGFRNDEGADEDRVAGLLREAAGRIPARGGDPAAFVERLLRGGTNRLFSCESPLGEVYVGVGPRGVRMVGRAESPDEFARRYRERFGRLLSDGANAKTRRLAARVAGVFAGEKSRIPVDLSRATPFQRLVLEVVEGIPRGEVRPYAWVAHEAGSPKAFRAVGTVMSTNPVPLVVPCHRVVRNDGTTGGYAFGPEEKVGLVFWEGMPVEKIAGKPYLATPTTGIVCHATCRNTRRITPENRRRFRSVGEALGAGYRPCKICRPAALPGAAR